MAGPTHYERLGVRPDAPLEEIRSAYRAAARRAHPDLAGSAAGGGQADMAALNEAWRVLSDPARRAVYDAGLRDATAPMATPGAGRPAPPVPAPRLPAHDGRFPKWPFVLLAALATIFIVTAGALSPTPRPAGPDNLLEPGSCVRIEPNGDAVEVTCLGAGDRVVVTVVGFDQACPFGTEAHRDRQGRGSACLET